MILPRNLAFERLLLDVGAAMAVSERSTVTVSKLIETYRSRAARLTACQFSIGRPHHRA
jgi:hypothetical protein